MLRQSSGYLGKLKLGIVLFAAVQMGTISLATNVVHTHTGNGNRTTDFFYVNPEGTHYVRGKAPADGDLHVELDQAGMTVLADFWVYDGASHTEAVLCSIYQVSLISDVSNYGSGTGKACVQSAGVASCISGGGGS